MTTSFPPDRGGVATLLGRLTSALTPVPLVLAPTPAAVPSDWEPPSPPPRWVRLEQRDLPGRAAYRLLWSLHPCLYYLRHLGPAAARMVRNSGLEVVQCGHVFTGLAALVLQRRYGLPYVLYAHAQEIRRSRRAGLPLLDRAIRSLILRRAAAILVLSEYTRQRALEWSVEPRRIVRFNAGGPAALPELRDAPSLPLRAGPVLLTVARLVPRKGIDTVIAALPQVLQHYPMARYIVVGSGPDLARLHELAERLGVAQHVTFAGTVDDRRLAEYYTACDLFIMPARETADGEVEGFGLVFLEAGAYGKPCIAGRSGGMANAVLDGETGLLVDPDQPQAVAEGILRLLDDPSWRRRLGLAARQKLEREWTWPNAAATVSAVLRQVAAGQLVS